MPLTNIEKQGLIQMRKKGVPWSQIPSKMVEIYDCRASLRTLHRIWAKYNKTYARQLKRPAGRPLKCTEREQRLVVREALVDRWASFPTLRKRLRDKGVDVSRHTISRTLKKSGLSRRIAATRQLLNKPMKRKRLLWAQRHSAWRLENWRNAVFSDEKLSNEQPPQGRTCYAGKGGALFATLYPTNAQAWHPSACLGHYGIQRVRPPQESP